MPPASSSVYLAGDDGDGERRLARGEVLIDVGVDDCSWVQNQHDDETGNTMVMEDAASNPSDVPRRLVLALFGNAAGPPRQPTPRVLPPAAPTVDTA